MQIAVLITVFNRKNKTLRCLKSLEIALSSFSGKVAVKVFLTDDGSTDGTSEAVLSESFSFDIKILSGTGTLYWNGGMINSWKAAIAEGGWDGYLWLNNDTEVLPSFWEDVLSADDYSRETYGKRGIYVGSTKDAETGALTYGGFIYTNKWTLKDKMLYPDNRSFQPCEAAHGNITFVSSDVVNCQGIFCEKYIHGGTDHDYSYLAHKAGFPVLVLPHFSGVCENDHLKDGGRLDFTKYSMKERFSALRSPLGLNLHNSLLFSKRCFPWRYPIVLATGYLRVLFPRAYLSLYRLLRGEY